MRKMTMLRCMFAGLCGCVVDVWRRKGCWCGVRRIGGIEWGLVVGRFEGWVAGFDGCCTW